MIVVDANLLIYASNADAPLHKRSKVWLEKALSGPETIGLPWIVLLAVIRLTTRPAIFRNPIPLEDALSLAAAWLDEPSVTVIHPGPHHWRILRSLLLAVGTGGNLTSDAHLAAMAIEHGAELCSADGDFARFPGLKWRNPLA